MNEHGPAQTPAPGGQQGAGAGRRSGSSGPLRARSPENGECCPGAFRDGWAASVQGAEGRLGCLYCTRLKCQGLSLTTRVAWVLPPSLLRNQKAFLLLRAVRGPRLRDRPPGLGRAHPHSGPALRACRVPTSDRRCLLPAPPLLAAPAHQAAGQRRPFLAPPGVLVGRECSVGGPGPQRDRPAAGAGEGSHELPL